MKKQVTIEVEIPEGYEATGEYRHLNRGELGLNGRGEVDGTGGYESLVLRQKKPTRLEISVVQWNQLVQLVEADNRQKPTWDGNLLSKDAMTVLVAAGLASKFQGYNFPTLAGRELYNNPPEFPPKPEVACSRCGFQGEASSLIEHPIFKANGTNWCGVVCPTCGSNRWEFTDTRKQA